MESKINSVKNIFENIKQNKKVQIIVLSVLIFLAVVILFQSYYPKEEGAVNDVAMSYIKSLEQRLEKVLCKVEGAGDVSVVLTIESGMETVLATKTEVIENSSGKQMIETPILVNGKTVVIKEKYPKITGVLIVAEGASSLTILTKIQQATVSLLDINVNQIEILTMK